MSPGQVAVMGAGSWGTTFAMVLADAGAEVRLWARRADVAASITDEHRNPEYLPATPLPAAVSATTDPAEAVAGAAVVVFALPAQRLRPLLADWRPLLSHAPVLVSLMKGIEGGSHARMSQVLQQTAAAPAERVAVVSGPNLAREIAARQPTASVVACVDLDVAERVAQACSAPYFRPYTNTDVVGVELGGAVKNVIALAVGIADGLGFGDNTKASVITRGLAETMRLGVALGADPATLAGLAGLGDLVATCASPLSRNRTFGTHLGRGLAVPEVVALTRQTAEGVTSCAPLVDLAASAGVELPICEAVLAVVRDGLPPREVVPLLLGRPRRAERDLA